jgi:hypothetical protein
MKRDFTPLRIVFLFSAIVIFLSYTSGVSASGNFNDEITCEILEVVSADYGKNNGSVTLKITGGVPPYALYWIPNYAVMFENSDQTLTFNNLKGDDSFTVYIDDSEGNSSFCGTYITHNPSDGMFCTYGIGFWGNKNGKGCYGGTPISTMDLMRDAIMNAGTPVLIGHSGAGFILDESDISDGNIFKILPGGGPSRAISGEVSFSDKSSWPYLPLSNKKSHEGKSQNSLFSQTLALFFNLNTNPNLAKLVIKNSVIGTIATDCATGEIKPRAEEKLYPIPQDIFDILSLDYGQTVDGLFQMANDALGGELIGIVNSDLEKAIAAINEAFDGCRAIVDWYDGSSPKIGNRILLEPSGLKAYPNPFRTSVNFEFVPDRDAQARLELFDMLGQKISTLLYIPVNKGVMNKVEYKPDGINSGFLFYRLTLGDEVTAGKMLYAK